MTAADTPPVAIIMGSQSDWETMKNAADTLEALDIAYEARIISAHRTPDRLYEFARGAKAAGYKVIVAGAGGAAHLPGMTAALTPLPVFGVPVESKALSGQDSLLSIVQMPAGIPVGTQAIVVAAILLVTIMHVGARRRQIGALRALGIPKRSIVAIVWGELFLLFAAGAALGISGGYAAARVISALLTARTAVRLPVEFSAADLPLALGTGAGSELRRPLGIAIVGGLLLSQFLTLYTTPVIYIYLSRFSHLRWFWRRKTGREIVVRDTGAASPTRPGTLPERLPPRHRVEPEVAKPR